MNGPRIHLRPGVTEPVVLMFSRWEVESGDALPAVDRLNVLFGNREAIWQYRGQVSLVVNGYNDDTRELVDIPEVRAFLREFDARWPYWAFFFNQVDDSIALLGSCLCAERYLGQGQVQIDPAKLRTFLLRGFGAMNALFNDNGFPESELEVMSNGVIEVIEQAGFSG